MKINTTLVIKNVKGEPYMEAAAEGKKAKELTLGSTISQMLSTTKSENDLQSFLLAQKFYQQKEVEISSEDVVFIKNQFKAARELPGAFYPYIVGQILQVLEK